MSEEKRILNKDAYGKTVGKLYINDVNKVTKETVQRMQEMREEINKSSKENDEVTL